MLDDADGTSSVSDDGDSYSERSSGGSLVGALFGLVLTIGSVIGLFWNEGRAVTTARSLAEGASLVAKVDAARVDSANAGRLVHVSGMAETTAALRDAELGVSESALRLVRVVEMYQWKEDRTKDKDTTRYTYKLAWAEGRISSEDFKRPGGHHNPEPAYKRRAVEAGDATLGAYRPGAAVLRKLPARETVAMPDSAAAAVKARTGREARVIDGVLHVGADPDAPRVGDLRISLRVARPGPVSIIGAQAGLDLAPFQTKAGDQLLMVSPGLLSADQMFAEARSMNTLLTWALRALGVIAMWLGLYLMMSPLVALFEAVPLIGSLVAAGAGLVALMITLVVAPVTIAVAWFYYRPLVSALVIGGGLALAFMTRGMTLGRAAPPAPTVAPARVPPRSFLPPQAPRPTVQRASTSFLPRQRIGTRQG